MLSEDPPMWFMLVITLWVMFITTVLAGLTATCLVLYIRRLIKCGPAAIWEPVMWFIMVISFCGMVATVLN